ISGHAIVDGGLLSNFAIDLLISKEDDIRQIMGTAGHKPNVLGFLIDENLPVPGAGDPPGHKPDKPSLLPKLDMKQVQTVQRISRLVDTMTNARDKHVITEYQDRVCRLPAQGYGTTEFDMTPPRIQAIITAGKKTMAAFLAKEPEKVEKAVDK
ncbi:MAG: hypothetical protein ACE5FD_09705, partial [Anaerolineae bacterium]